MPDGLRSVATAQLQLEIVAQNVQATARSIERVRRQLGRASKSQDQAAKGSKRLGAAVAGVDKQLRSQAQAVGLAARGWQNFKNVFSRVAFALATFVIIRSVERAIIAFSKSLVSANEQLEYMGQQLAVLYNFTSRVRRIFDFLKELAVATPAQLQELIQSSVTLKAFGEDVQATMPALLDWSAAVGRSVEDIALRFAKIAAGTPRTRMLLTTAGLTMQEFANELERTGDRTQALLNVIEARYGGMAIEIAGTFRVIVSNIKDAMFLISAALGEPVFDRIKRDLQGILDYLSELRKQPERLREVGEAFEAIYRQVSRIIAALPKLTDATIYFVRSAKRAAEDWELLFPQKEIQIVLRAIESLQQRMQRQITIPLPAVRAESIEAVWQASRRAVQGATVDMKALQTQIKLVAKEMERLRLEQAKGVDIEREIKTWQELQVALDGAVERAAELAKLADLRVKDAGTVLDVLKLQSGAFETLAVRVRDHLRSLDTAAGTTQRIRENVAMWETIVEILQNPMKAIEIAQGHIDKLLESGQADTREILSNLQLYAALLKWIESDERKRAQELERQRRAAEQALRQEERALRAGQQTTAALVEAHFVRQKTLAIGDKEREKEIDRLRILAQIHLKRQEIADLQERMAAQKVLPQDLPEAERTIAQLNLDIANLVERLARSFQDTDRRASRLARKLESIRDETRSFADLMGIEMAQSIDRVVMGFVDATLRMREQNQSIKERIRGLREELEIIQGKRQRLTREQEIQREITRLQRERVSTGRVILGLLGSVVKEALRSIAQYVSLLLQERAMTSMLKKRLEREKEITEEKRRQFRLMLQMLGLQAAEGAPEGEAGRGEDIRAALDVIQTVAALASLLKNLPAFQHGFDGVVRRPTAFIAGERGPEHVRVTPMPMAQRPDLAPARIELHVHGDVYDRKHFLALIDEANERLSRRRA